MAEAAEEMTRLDQFLRAIAAHEEDLPALAEEWDSLPDGERASVSLHWGHLMLDCLTELDERYHDGSMTPGQASSYENLLRRLRAREPILEKLDLERPCVRLPRVA